MKNRIANCIEDSIKLKNIMLKNEQLIHNIELIAQESIKAFTNKRKVLLCGNGGSAADAQHIAAELSGRFYKDRPALFAEALHVNTSYLTSVANDYGYDNTYSRMIQACGNEGDILIAISTSGNSINIINAIKHSDYVYAFNGSDNKIANYMKKSNIKSILKNKKYSLVDYSSDMDTSDRINVYNSILKDLKKK